MKKRMEKKRMEKKNRPRSKPVYNAAGRKRYAIPAVCLILFILFTSVPLTRLLPADTVFAAGTETGGISVEAFPGKPDAEESVYIAAAPEGEDNSSRGDPEEAGKGRTGDTALPEEGTEQSGGNTQDTGSQDNSAGKQDSPAESQDGSTDTVDGTDEGKSPGEGTADPETGVSSGSGGSGAEKDSSAKDASVEDNTREEDGTQVPSGDEAAPNDTGKDAESDEAGEKGNGSRNSSSAENVEDSAGESSEESGKLPENDGNIQSAEGEENGSSSTAADEEKTAETEAAEQPVDVFEKPWMTVTEFNRAYNSVTSGARGTGGYVPSKATIISKESEIDYTDLGIGTDGSGHRGHTTPINIRDEEGNEYTGICVVPDDRGLPRWSVLPNVTKVTDAVMIKLYYYTMLDSYGENLAKDKGFGSNAKKVAIAACHEAMSMRYAELAGITYDRPNLGNNLRSLVSAYRSGAASKALPDMDKVSVYISARTQSDGTWMQAYVFGFVAEDEPSSIVLQKTSSDPDMRNAYSAYYCLHETANGGAVNFRLYTDKACTKAAHVYSDENMTSELSVIPVGMSGKSGLWNKAVFYCEAGTYYLKELNTPRGYQTRSEPFGPYTVKEGGGLNIRVANTPLYAKAGIIKKDAESGKGLAGAKYGLYADKEDARNGDEPAGIFTTGQDGKSNLLEVIAGKTYYVREISAPEGYKKDTRISELKTASDLSAAVWTELADEPDVGRVQVKKSSSDTAADTEDPDSPYSLAGAVYTLYGPDGGNAGTLTTKKDGTSNVLTVRCGSYTLRETTPSPGFALDETVHKITVTGGSETTVESKEPALKGKIAVQKQSSEEKDGKAEDTLPVKGAMYSLYNSAEDAEEARPAAGTFVIREDGSSNTVEVVAGRTYYVKETKTPEGYLPDEKIHTVRVDSLTETVTVQSVEQLIFGGVKVCKRDLETGENKPLGGAVLEGTTIKIYNDGSLSVYADGKKILPGAEALTLVTGDDGTAQTSEHALSYGTYRVEEAAAPEGYTKKGSGPVRFSVTENGKITDLSASKETSVSDRVMRGDVSIRKFNGYTQKRMAGVTFEITSYDRDGKELEKHRFTTDENGVFESTAAWAARQKAAGEKKEGQPQQNASDPEEQDGLQTQEGQEDSERLWFGIGTTPDDALGALPYGAYHIEEIEGENNRGMKMFSDDFSVYADMQTIALGNIENTMKPVLETELLDEDGGHFSDGKGIVTLTDTVTYGGMEEYIGKEVTFHGVIYVKETGEPLKIDGRTVECVQTRKILSPSATVQLRFTFDASRAQGMTLVCFEYASEAVTPEADSGEHPSGTEEPSDTEEPSGTEEPGEEETSGNSTEPYHDSTNGGKDIVSHTDIEDASQTVRLVLIETDARDQLTGMHIGQARDGAVTVDHVTCRGLIPGQKYLVTGFLVDKANGRPLRDAEGADITAKASFTAKNTEETVDLTFTYDASLLEGTTVVAFERLYLGGDKKPSAQNPGEDTPGSPDTPDTPDSPDGDGGDTPIAVHEDPDDEDQSVHYPKIRTLAEAGKTVSGTGSGDGERIKEPAGTVTADGKLTVRDRVVWNNLLPGKKYRLQGSLMCKDDGKAFTVDGEPVKGEASFIPDTGDGETYLYFTFDSTGLFKDAEAEKTDGSGTEKTSGSDGAEKTETEKTELRSVEIVAFEELYILVTDPSEEKPAENGSSGNDPAQTDPAEDSGSGSTDKKEHIVAEHKDLQDPAQTVLLREPEVPVKSDETGDTDEPDTTDTTDTPDRTEEPEKTDSPPDSLRTDKSTSNKKSVSPASPETIRSGSSVKTGDDTSISAFLIPAVLSALGVAAVILAKRRMKKK